MEWWVGGEPRKTAPPPARGVSFGRAAVRDASAIPSRAVLGRYKSIHCLAVCFFRISLLFSQLSVWGDGSGSDPGGAVSHLAQINLLVVIWVGHFEHHTDHGTIVITTIIKIKIIIILWLLLLCLLLWAGHPSLWCCLPSPLPSSGARFSSLFCWVVPLGLLFGCCCVWPSLLLRGAAFLLLALLPSPPSLAGSLGKIEKTKCKKQKLEAKKQRENKKKKPKKKGKSKSDFLKPIPAPNPKPQMGTNRVFVKKVMARGPKKHQNVMWGKNTKKTRENRGAKKTH